MHFKFMAHADLIALILSFFGVALLYSSVGFGGGSSYLAILALVFSSFFVVRSSALLCNLVVVSGSSWLYFGKGHLKVKKFLPFLATSIPAAFIGASFRLREQVFFIILGISLVASAGALALQTVQKKPHSSTKKYPLGVPFSLGAGVGLLSGMVGIGGGIFLAPILNHLRWEKPVVIAALASFFIFVNSIAGIAGLFWAGTFELAYPEIFFLILAVLLGGQLGTRMGIGKFSAGTIRLVTALLVFVVGIRVLIENS